MTTLGRRERVTCSLHPDFNIHSWKYVRFVVKRKVSIVFENVWHIVSPFRARRFLLNRRKRRDFMAAMKRWRAQV